MTSASITAPAAGATLRPVECDEHGVWHVRGYAEAKKVLLADTTIQAGFKAEFARQAPKYIVLPILFQHGAEHRTQRSETARFFTPTITHQRYLEVMERCARQIIDGFKQAGRADLNRMARRMALTVVAEVIGLSQVSLGRMDYHLDKILTSKMPARFRLRNLPQYLQIQRHLLNFFLFSVKPATRAHRRTAYTDLIAHLVSKNRRDVEILTECIMYAAAGMVTTQEFICVAAWHCLQRPELRARMLGDDQQARYRCLHEILRLEPVVGHIYRRATGNVSITSDGQTIVIPAGALIDVDIYRINADARAAGQDPLELLPERPIETGIPRSVMGFGAGAHHCAGEFVALAETDVFLRHLLALDGLFIERAPAIGHNDITSGYELRQFRIGLKR